MSDRVEAVRVVGGKRDREREDGRGDGADPGLHLAAADAEPAEEGNREPGRGDEAGDGDVQVTDVVVERGAERFDLVLADVDLTGSDSEFEEAVGEVAN